MLLRAAVAALVSLHLLPAHLLRLEEGAADGDVCWLGDCLWTCLWAEPPMEPGITEGQETGAGQ